MYISTEDIYFILMPILNQTKKLISLSLPDDLKKISEVDEIDLISTYNRETTKIYKILFNLIGQKELYQKYKSKLTIQEEVFYNKIELLSKVGFLIQLETSETGLQLEPDIKLLITPLGIIFISTFLNEQKQTIDSINLNKLLIITRNKLGKAYNNYLSKRIIESLRKSESNLSKKEIIIALFLLMVEAISPERAVRSNKPVDENLRIPISFIGNRIFIEDEQLFPVATSLDNAIRASTGVSGLEGKTLGLYNKKTHDGVEYHLFFQLNKNGLIQNLSYLVHRISESIRTHERNDRVMYLERLIDIFNEHCLNRNLIFENKAYLRHSLLLDTSISAPYLTTLRSLFIDEKDRKDVG